MIIKARFIKSAQLFSQSPAPKCPEIAFLGRSNVGKSSTINALTRQKQLAKSSATPGKTRLINFFEVDFKDDENRFSLGFVDLPGFGYARVSKDLRQSWDKNLNEFLTKRKSIRLFVHLIDARHSQNELDALINEYLSGIMSPKQRILRVFTKMDKLNQSQKTLLKNAFKGGVFISNLAKTGLDELESELIKIRNDELESELIKIRNDDE